MLRLRTQHRAHTHLVSREMACTGSGTHHRQPRCLAQPVEPRKDRKHMGKGGGEAKRTSGGEGEMNRAGQNTPRPQTHGSQQQQQQDRSNKGDSTQDLQLPPQHDERTMKEPSTMTEPSVWKLMPGVARKNPVAGIIPAPFQGSEGRGGQSTTNATSRCCFLNNP